MTWPDCCEHVLGCDKPVLQRMTPRFQEEHLTFGLVTHVKQVTRAIGGAMETVKLSCALGSPYGAGDQASMFTFMHLGHCRNAGSEFLESSLVLLLNCLCHRHPGLHREENYSIQKAQVFILYLD